MVKDYSYETFIETLQNSDKRSARISKQISRSLFVSISTAQNLNNAFFQFYPASRD